MRSFKNEGVGRVAGNFAEVRVHRRRAPGRDDGRAFAGNSMPNSWIDFLPTR